MMILVKKPINAKVIIKALNKSYIIGEGIIYIGDTYAGVYTLKITSEGYDSKFLKDIDVLPEQNLTFGVELSKVFNRYH